MTGLERKMVHVHVESALNERRHAHFCRRIGDNIGFRFGMRDARFRLRLARQWKPKHDHPILRNFTEYKEAAE